jgi:hypothetical protein
MKRLWIFIVLVGLFIAACQPTADITLPTQASLPSLTPGEASPEATAQMVADTDTPEPSATPVPATLAPTETTEETDATVEAEAPTATPTSIPAVTIEMREEVRFATLTPAPQGDNQPIRTTPVVMADVVITQGDFQRAMDAALVDNETIQGAEIDFVSGGIDVELTALGGVAYITGRVKVQIQMSGSFASITIGDVQVNAAEPPEAYLEVVNGEFFGLLIQVFDALLTERVGEGHDLENILLNDQAMQVFLLVPQNQ